MKEWIKEHKKVLGILVLFVVLFIGISYAWLRLTVIGKKEVSVKGNNLDIILIETNGDLIIEDAIPVVDETGKVGNSFKFYIQNNSLVDVDYDLLLIDNKEKQKECEECEYIPYNDIRYELKRVNLEKVDSLTENRVIDNGNLKRGEKNRIYYELKIWLDINAGNEAQGKVFYGKVAINATQVNQPNGPILADNMIPVVYDGTDKRWEKADVTSEWYNYNNQEWANAVTVTATSRSGYQQAKAGVEVKMADILQMWVWIPRYSYTIKSEDGTHYYGKKEDGRLDEPSQLLPGEIDIKFIRKDEKDENGSAQYTGKYATNWYTPPGFTFGEEELSGIWVGKFETGYSSGEGTGVGVDNEIAARKDIEEPNKAIIKPNVYSWRMIRVSTIDLVSRRMIESGNVFGYDQSTYDSHAMKNSEWALISYLTQSKYGKYGNPLYSGMNKEVYMNAYNAYVTGCSFGVPSAASTTTCENQYDVMTDRGNGQGYAGAGASSTGNITGIYDINGGAWEYTMGVLNKMSGNTATDNSGYTGQLADESTFQGRVWPAAKYYDLYTSNDLTTACNGNPCKGHALNEVAGWYGDYSSMVYKTNPWSVRGGCHSVDALAGVFGFSTYFGSVLSSLSFRQVLTPIVNS